MPFTPSEIKHKSFSRVKNGYEATEVANYLEQLSKEIERLKEDKKQLEKVIEDKETNLKSYKDVHQSVSDALVQAQKQVKKRKLLLRKRLKRRKRKRKRKLTVSLTMQWRKHVAYLSKQKI